MHAVKEEVLAAKEILYEDNHLLIVNKRPGLLVQRDKTDDPSLMDIAKEYIRKKYNKPGNIFLGLPHRIDRPASGAVILCKTTKSLSRISQTFRSRQIRKEYLAILTSAPPDDKGKLVHWIIKNEKTNKVQVYTKERPGSLRAELEYEILAQRHGNHLVKVNLLTGRSHQIRAQFSKIKCPVAGDLKYGALNAEENKNICLHSSEMEFPHPVKKIPVKITASLPGTGSWKLFKNFQHSH